MLASELAEKLCKWEDKKKVHTFEFMSLRVSKRKVQSALS